MSILDMQWMSDKKALKLVYDKPCRICGQPSCCAVRDYGYGIVPVCMAHGIAARKVGYIVAFPEPPIMPIGNTKLFDEGEEK